MMLWVGLKKRPNQNIASPCILPVTFCRVSLLEKEIQLFFNQTVGLPVVSVSFLHIQQTNLSNNTYQTVSHEQEIQLKVGNLIEMQ